MHGNPRSTNFWPIAGRLTRPGIELGYSEEDLNEGLSYMQEVGNKILMADIQAAAGALKPGGKVSAVGFCWGRQLAWLTTKSADVNCAVSYYSIAVPHTVELGPNCPVMLHFADNDAFVRKEAADEARAAYPGMQIQSYEANHGFNCDRRDDYDEGCAK